MIETFVHKPDDRFVLLKADLHHRIKVRIIATNNAVHTLSAHTCADLRYQERTSWRLRLQEG